MLYLSEKGKSYHLNFRTVVEEKWVRKCTCFVLKNNLSRGRARKLMEMWKFVCWVTFLHWKSTLKITSSFVNGKLWFDYGSFHCSAKSSCRHYYWRLFLFWGLSEHIISNSVFSWILNPRASWVKRIKRSSVHLLI